MNLLNSFRGISSMPVQIQLFRYRFSASQPEPQPTLPEDRTVNAIQKRLPHGVYTTFRTYQRSLFFRLDDHFRRLGESAALMGSPLRVESQRIRQALREILQNVSLGELRVRLSLDLTENPGDLYVIIEPLTLPDSASYVRGVHVVTETMCRETPKAKSTDFTLQAENVREKRINGASEVLMVSSAGEMLEGLSSNFFAISRGIVYTADQGVLSGITRGLVLEIIRECHLPVRFTGFKMAEIDQLDEAFITSVSRGILPVVSIDAHGVGSGEPGDITKNLMSQLEGRIAESLEAL